MAKSRKRTVGDRRATAYHEAGHAVIAVAQGLAINKVSVIPGQDYYGVCVHPSVYGYSFSTKRERRSIARGIIVSIYAGMHGQRLVDPDPQAVHGGDDDNHAFELSREFEVFPRRCNLVGDDRHYAYLDRLSGEARRLVKKHRSVIEKLAELLLVRKELGGTEAEEFIQVRLGQ